MITGIGGWERCGKTLLAAILATETKQLNFPNMQQYNIEQGFGNLHLFKTPYPWTYLDNVHLKMKIREIHEKQIRNVLILIDEVEDVFNNRDYNNPEQKRTLKGLGQHAKMGRHIIYTYQMGQPEDALLGPDKILRSNTRLEFEMRYYDIKEHFAMYHLKNRLGYNIPESDGVIKNVTKYFDYYDTNECVV